jgi:peroxiredoxin
VILGTAGGLLLALWARGTLGAPGLRPGASGTQEGPRTADHRRVKHYVTPRQLAASNTMVNRSVADLKFLGADGRSLGWEGLSGGRPVVLVFIKDGCPCSVEFEPFFQRVEKLYRREVRFAGVIDASLASARRYAKEQRVPYPVLPDPEHRIIRRLKAENGGYVVLLTRRGVIDGFWPGCTTDTLRLLGRGIARLAGVAERPLDVSGMPGSTITGCPFES